MSTCHTYICGKTTEEQMPSTYTWQNCKSDVFVTSGQEVPTNVTGHGDTQECKILAIFHYSSPCSFHILDYQKQKKRKKERITKHHSPMGFILTKGSSNMD